LNNEKYFLMAWVYILLSEKNNNFYIGATRNLKERIVWHNSILQNTGYSKKGIPWTLYFQIECKSFETALKIERHIKNMKSRKYIENLLIYPEITLKLLEKYNR